MDYVTRLGIALLFWERTQHRQIDLHDLEDSFALSYFLSPIG